MPPKQSMWADTSVYVTKSFRLNKVLAHRIPSQITFTEDDKKIYFLAGSGRSCLYSVNFDQGICMRMFVIVSISRDYKGQLEKSRAFMIFVARINSSLQMISTLY